MKQMNNHAPLPYGWGDIETDAMVSGAGGVMSRDRTLISKETFEFIFTACNNFYKMKELLLESAVTLQTGNESAQMKAVRKIRSFLKEIDPDNS